MVEVVYLTTKEKRYMPTHTDVLCKVPSTSICENISTVSKDRLGDFVRTCTDAEIEKINEAMLHSLGISHSEEREVEEAPTDITKLAVEKDLYKNLYEQLLDKLAAR
jgi:mRNA interferase MazF